MVHAIGLVGQSRARRKAGNTNPSYNSKGGGGAGGSRMSPRKKGKAIRCCHGIATEFDGRAASFGDTLGETYKRFKNPRKQIKHKICQDLLLFNSLNGKHPLSKQAF